MASIRNLKREINNRLGEIIDLVYEWEARIGKNNTKAGSLIIDNAIAVNLDSFRND